MKVLQVLTSAFVGGGPQAVLTLTQGLLAEGVNVSIAAPRGPMLDEFRKVGASVLEVRLGLSPTALPALGSVIRAAKPDVLHAHGKSAGLWGRLAARACSVPSVFTFHGLHHERYPGPLRRLYLALERGLARLTRAQVFVSEADALEAVALGITGPCGTVIRNGVDADRLQAEAMDREAARRALALPPGLFVLGTAARVDPVKRLDFLVEVLGGVPEDMGLCLLGDGPGRDALWRRARALGCQDRLILAGERPRAWRFLPALDLYVTASAREGCPLGLLEAMALGRPVLASDIPAHREILGEAPEQTARAELVAWVRHVRFLRGQADLRRRLGEQNRALVAERYRAADMVKAHLALYEAVRA